MDDALLMGIGQPLTELRGNFELLDERELNVRFQKGIKVAPSQQLHDDVGRAIDFTKFVNRDDVSMLKPGHRSGLSLKPLTRGGVVREIDEHHLERHVPLED